MANRLNELSFTLFKTDTLVNYALAFLFIFFYKPLENLMSDTKLLPRFVWIGLGLGFLLFSFWQTYIVRGKKFQRKAQIFSGVMAWIPFLLLTYVLVFMDLPLFKGARIIVWIGNMYMFVLGWIYLLAARQKSRL